MNNQEAFNKIWERAKDYRRALSAFDSMTCVYRDPVNRTKCFVGELIPDDEYSPEMEGYAVEDLVKNFDIPELADVDVLLMKELQILHDSRSQCAWADELRKIAVKYHLTVPD